MNSKIGENIRRVRIRKGMSQKELAEKAGMTNVLLNNYEHGMRNPKAETLKKLADALGVSPEVLSGEEMTEKQAKKRLYSIFRQYDGHMVDIAGKKLVWFDKLDLEAFYRSYQTYMRQLDEAEETTDPAVCGEMKKAARDSFEEWIDLSEE